MKKNSLFLLIILALNSFVFCQTNVTSDGTTATGHIPKMSGTYTVLNSEIYESSGKIGIGTTTPVGKLNIFTGVTGATRDISSQSNGSISFSNSGSSTASPTISGKSDNSIGLYLMGATNNSNTIDMCFNVVENDYSEFSTLTSSAFSFITYNVRLLDILRNGNVGIGTTSPGTLLHLNSTTSAGTDYLLTLEDDANAASEGLGIKFKEAGGTDMGSISCMTYTGSRAIEFNPGSALTPVMKVFSDGNVGIGTTSNASQKLEIAHNDATGGIALNRLTGTSSKSEIKFSKAGTELWAIGNDLTNDGSSTFFIWDNTAETSRLFIDEDGFIGIGTEEPNFKLDIESGSAGGLEVKTTHSQGNGYAIIAKVNNNETKAFSAFYNNTENFIVYGSGSVYAREVHVSTASPLGDFVFDNDYVILSISELEAFINTNKHLPGIPSAAEVQENGMNVGEFQNLLLQKVEEQSLYIISLQKQIDELKALMNASINK